MKIGQDTVVTLAQRVTDASGAVIDDGRDPIRYVHGGYQDIFEKLESALDGKSVGDSITVTLAPGDGFEDYDVNGVQIQDIANFEAPPKVGDVIEGAIGDDVCTGPLRVTDITENKAVLDANHPLAGVTLVFAATVKAVRRATEAEIADKRSAAKAEEQTAKADLSISSRLGDTARYYSETHRVCHVGPLFLLPVPAVYLGLNDRQVACGLVVVLWVLWAWLARWLTSMAIGRWGDKFLFFDFSPNRVPSTVERRIAVTGGLIPLLAALATLVVGLSANGWTALWETLGISVSVLMILGIPGTILIPFVIILLSGFRVRPVLEEDAPASAGSGAYR